MNKKETFVLLPGYDGDGEKTFGKLKTLLADKYQIKIINFPYLNKPEKQYSLDELVEWINNEIEESSIILAFSLGGFIAKRLTELHPQKVKKLILVSSSVAPKLNNHLKNILWWANHLFRIRSIAMILTKLFLAADTSGIPVPKLAHGFDVKMGYAVFGTLSRVASESRWTETGVETKAVLFEDDNSFPAKVYGPALRKLGIKVVVYEIGGHAQSEDYWDKVAKAVQG